MDRAFGKSGMLPIITTYPADTELLPEPIPSGWVLDGLPQARAAAIARAVDDGMWIAVWACTPGKFRWHYDVDETIHILSGEVFIIDDNGMKQRLASGDTAFFPAGTSIIWHITEEVRKVAVCRIPLATPVVLASKLWRKVTKAFRRCHRMAGLVAEVSMRNSTAL